MFRWCADLLDACFPRACPFCDRLYRPTPLLPVCPECHAATQWLEGPLLTAHFPRPAWDAARPLCRFDGPVVAAIHRLKYRGREDIGILLGHLLTLPAFAIGSHDVVLPVPLGRARLRARGYNQAQCLARPVARALGRPMELDALVRTRETASQVALGPVARRANLHGAFAIRPEQRHAIAGRRCLLIDDVCTTGATLHAAASAIRRAGAAAVRALVVAVA